MNVYEITEAKASSLLFYVAQSRRELARESLREVIAFAYEEGRKSGATEAGQYVLEYLSDLYDGVQETDVWADYFSEEEAGE